MEDQNKIFNILQQVQAYSERDGIFFFCFKTIVWKI